MTSSAGAWIARQAVRRGLLGSSRVWFAVFLASGAARGLRWLLRSGRRPEVLSQRLEPGAGIQIRHLRGRAG